MKCPRPKCRADVHAATPDGPVRCEDGHNIPVSRPRVQAFLSRSEVQV